LAPRRSGSCPPPAAAAAQAVLSADPSPEVWEDLSDEEEVGPAHALGVAGPPESVSGRLCEHGGSPGYAVGGRGPPGRRVGPRGALAVSGRPWEGVCLCSSSAGPCAMHGRIRQLGLQQSCVTAPCSGHWCSRTSTTAVAAYASSALVFQHNHDGSRRVSRRARAGLLGRVRVTRC
jgi:hypothetical protein